LETVRAYAHERLEEAGELATMRDRHLRWSMDLAQQAQTALRVAGQDAWLERLGTEHDNFRAALAWALEASEVETALQPAWALEWFWYIRGYLSEGRLWLEKALSRACGDGAPLLTRDGL
jgi:predicted ATPase